MAPWPAVPLAEDVVVSIYVVLSERNAFISAPVMSAARADPIRPTTPVVTMMAHAIIRMVLFLLGCSVAHTLSTCGRHFSVFLKYLKSGGTCSFFVGIR